MSSNGVAHVLRLTCRSALHIVSTVGNNMIPTTPSYSTWLGPASLEPCLPTLSTVSGQYNYTHSFASGTLTHSELVDAPSPLSTLWRRLGLAWPNLWNDMPSEEGAKGNIDLTSHQTWNPNVMKRKRCHGFLKRCAHVACDASNRACIAGRNLDARYLEDLNDHKINAIYIT